MRVVILTNRQENQVALVNKITEHCDVVAVVVSKNIPRRKPGSWKRFRRLVNSVTARTAGREFVDTWFQILAEYGERYRHLPTENVIEVSNVNDQATIDAIELNSPDLVVVSGTNLIGRRVIEASQRYGSIVNLHTGISPYVRGGPNCTNWCLAKGWFHLIGSTVMWLDIGIDTGNIIVTEQTPLDGSETLFDLHWKVMEHAHSIYAGAIALIGTGKSMPNVKQLDVDPGSHFNSSDWTAVEIRRAVNNYRKRYREYFEDSEQQAILTSELKLFPLIRD